MNCLEAVAWNVDFYGELGEFGVDACLLVEESEISYCVRIWLCHGRGSGHGRYLLSPPIKAIFPVSGEFLDFLDFGSMTPVIVGEVELLFGKAG